MAVEPCGGVEPLHSAWLDGELSEEERDRVARHLQACPPCRARVDGLDRTRTVLRGAPIRTMPVAVRASVAAGLAGQPPGQPVRGPVQRKPVRQGGHLVARRSVPVRTAGRVASLALGLVGMVGAAAFALGGAPPQEVRRVAVPVELFVADHVVRTVGGPVSTPVLLER